MGAGDPVCPLAPKWGRETHLTGPDYGGGGSLRRLATGFKKGGHRLGERQNLQQRLWGRLSPGLFP
jgi:hypothetical protein